MATLDWVVIAAYFAGLLGLAWWVILKGKDTAEDYFLSGRSLSWFVIGASIFASNIGSEHREPAPGPERRGDGPPSCTPGACWCWAG
jgi:hypothetical protein